MAWLNELSYSYGILCKNVYILGSLLVQIKEPSMSLQPRSQPNKSSDQIEQNGFLSHLCPFRLRSVLLVSHHIAA